MRTIRLKAVSGRFAPDTWSVNIDELDEIYHKRLRPVTGEDWTIVSEFAFERIQANPAHQTKEIEFEIMPVSDVWLPAISDEQLAGSHRLWVGWDKWNKRVVLARWDLQEDERDYPRIMGLSHGIFSEDEYQRFYRFGGVSTRSGNYVRYTDERWKQLQKLRKQEEKIRTELRQFFGK